MKDIPIAEERIAQRVEAERSYDGLVGEWADWLAVAKKYEHKVLYQDRLDMKHSIIVELHRARQRDGKPLPELRAYKIASLKVALYWRERVKREVRVCNYNGLPVESHCATCNRKPKVGRCVYLALRPIESLDKTGTDRQGIEHRLLDTVADDKAIDLECWLDYKTFLLGCPVRLIEIANKKIDGLPLTKQEQNYLYHYRNREFKKHQISLF